MITKKQKEHKLKLIYLIMIVNTEYARRKPFKNVWEAIAFGCEQVMWINELRTVMAQRTFKSGGIAIVGDNKRPEVISLKNK